MPDDDDIQAQTPDGMIHSFPAGTAPEVVDGAIKKYLSTKSTGVDTDALQRSTMQQARGELPKVTNISDQVFKPSAGPSPAGRGGYFLPRYDSPEEAKSGAKGATIMGASSLASALVPAAGAVSNLLYKPLAAAGGAYSGTMGGQALTGDNPFTPRSQDEALGNAALFGGSELGANALSAGAKGLLNTKPIRGFINRSLGATAQDVTYGNPAKALLDNDISTPFTGDIEKYKGALRSGASPADAEKAAGGRFAAVSQKISEYAPQLDAALNSSQAKLKVSDVIDKPLYDAATDIVNNRAMTAGEKDAAISKLGDLQSEMKQGLGDEISPSEASEIKRAIGDRVNWGRESAIGDEVKPAYKNLYGSLKKGIHDAVPGAKTLDEKLTDLLAAKSDLENTAKVEEAGKGQMAGLSTVGKAEAILGRTLPLAGKASSALTPVARWAPRASVFDPSPQSDPFAPRQR